MHVTCIYNAWWSLWSIWVLDFMYIFPFVDYISSSNWYLRNNVRSYGLDRIIVLSDGTLALQKLHIFSYIMNIILEPKSKWHGCYPVLHFALPPCCCCWLCGIKACCNKNFRGNGITVWNVQRVGHAQTRKQHGELKSRCILGGWKESGLKRGFGALRAKLSPLGTKINGVTFHVSVIVWLRPSLFWDVARRGL